MTRRYVELTLRLQIQSELAYWIRGDALFGHLCRTYADLAGMSAMDEMAQHYTRGEPWCVVSDARPEGYLPRPCVPAIRLFPSKVPQGARQNFKARNWVSRDATTLPLHQWGMHCLGGAEISQRYEHAELSTPGTRLWYTINRHTGEHAGGTQSSCQYVAASVPLEVSIIVDTHQVSVEHIAECVSIIGLEGFGRHRSSGWGRFKIIELFTLAPSFAHDGESLLTLAPCAPQGLDLDPNKSWYRSLVHFGKLGPAQTARVGGVHKTPILLAATGAILTPRAGCRRPFFGQPIGGSGLLSSTLSGAIHQGYAPYVPIVMQVDVQESVAS
jgi:CRISPR-associated protein Csm4